MRVGDCTIRSTRFIDPDETLEQAARTMTEINADVLPVGENGHLVGVITDRDIAISCVVQARPSDTKVRDVMSSEVLSCFDDDDVEDVLNRMAEARHHAVPVLNGDEGLVGMISICDLAITQAG